MIDNVRINNPAAKPKDKTLAWHNGETRTRRIALGYPDKGRQY